jgi:hypothetical protein
MRGGSSPESVVSTLGQGDRILKIDCRQSVMNLQRRSLRLQGYDYAQSGAYFVTICTHQRLPLFGQVVDAVTDI